MIALHGRATATSVSAPLSRSVWRLVEGTNGTSARQRHAQAFVATGDRIPPEGFGLYFIRSEAAMPPFDENVIQLPAQLDYLHHDDIVSVSPDGNRIRVIWRHESRQNSILLTERCNHYCLMCSQPPKLRNDDWLLEDAFELIRLLPAETSDIGFTGGEPTLYGDKLLELLRLCRNLIPQSAVHVLSNGRRFRDLDFACGWAAVDNPNMMVGIPLYGSEPALHDYVVQSPGAFNDTVAGILNLARLHQRIEVRVVVHKQTAPHLVEIAEFVSRNLPFVDQVALMGLEMIGFARANMNDVWIDPVDYRDQLTEATLLLDQKKIKVMVYNHQLCLIDDRIWSYAVRSISDWKNEYHSECKKCAVQAKCGGFFFSAKYRMSEHIRAIQHVEGEDTASLVLTQ
jgi:His-Xaa-Ser system radical SAM maturase HxsC